MCGIAGFYNAELTEPQRRASLEAMLDSIQHRGPDDSGTYLDDRLSFGMRRLSIIDLAGGHQPISTPDDSQHIVFNGEIYNYQQIRPDLEQAGVPFRTNSDTEVILHLLANEGLEGIHRLNGMFAFAIWDRQRGRLTLARDRMGVKPLYYYWNGKTLVFASEIKAILASGLVDRKVNPQAIWDYLTLRYVPQPETIWQGIQKLPPGHTLQIDAQSGGPVIRRWWDIPYSDTAVPGSAEDYVAQFEELFLDAVRLRLIADVPVGILLSGGLDSSAVAAAIGEVHNARLSSFSVAFKDSPGTDELPYARQAAQQVGTDHNEIVIGQQEFMDFLPRMLIFTDEPLADLASVPLYYVSWLARQKVKVVLSGEGADEILGGYDFDRQAARWDAVRRFQILPGAVRGIIGAAGGRVLPGQYKRRLQQAMIPIERLHKDYPLSMTSIFSRSQKEALWCGPEVEDLDTGRLLRAEMQRVNSGEPLHQALFGYCQSWLVEDLLMKADKMTMANSLELRVPFLDYRLVEWAAKAAPEVKVRRENGKYVSKWVLRQFAQKRLPEDILTRPKQGFPVPVYEWLTGPLAGWAKETLGSGALVHGYLEAGRVQKLAEQATTEGSALTDRRKLWNLLVLEIWLQEWMRGK